MFDQQLTWRQQLDDERERQQRAKREAEEQEILKLRGCAAGGRKAQPRSRRPQSARTGGEPGRWEVLDADAVFARFYERNCDWQRAREDRTEQRSREDWARVCRLSHAKHDRVAARGRARSAPARAEQQELHPDGGVREPPIKSVPPPAWEEPLQPPVRALAAYDGEPAERAEVLQHLRALQSCLSACAGTPGPCGWQLALRAERSHAPGADAAPCRRSHSECCLRAPRARLVEPMPSAG